MAFVCNPLGVITGGICPNHRKCKKKCVLSRQRGVEPKNVLVIGSGPAGLAAADTLNKRGFSVTVYEKEATFGGALWLIPDARLDKKHINATVELLKENGVTFEAGKQQIDKYVCDDFDHVIIATGTYGFQKLGIKGEQGDNVVYAIDYLKSGAGASDVVVIGGGNVAVDCAVQSENATVCYRRTEAYLKANHDEIEHAKEKGVRFEFEMVPEKITDEGVYFKNGRFLPCDKVVIAVGQKAVLPFSVDGLQNVVVVGDAEIGPSSVVQAVENAKKVCMNL